MNPNSSLFRQRDQNFEVTHSKFLRVLASAFTGTRPFPCKPLSFGTISPHLAQPPLPLINSTTNQIQSEIICFQRFVYGDLSLSSQLSPLVLLPFFNPPDMHIVAILTMQL